MTRWLVRLVCVVVAGFGLLLEIVYPLALEHEAGREIGSWQVYAPGSGFGRFETSFTRRDAPVDIHVRMTAGETFQPPQDLSVASLAIWGDGHMIIAAPLYFTRPEDGQEPLYLSLAGRIDRVDAERYIFVLMPGEAQETDIAAIDVLLRVGEAEPDQTVLVIGYILTVLGLGGLVLSFRRCRQPPAAPGWGRA